MKLFQSILKNGQDQTALGRLVSAVETIQSEDASTLATLQRVGLKFSGEALSSTQTDALDMGVSTLQRSLEQSTNDIKAALCLSDDDAYSETQIKAGTAGAIYASSLEGFLRAPVKAVIDPAAANTVVPALGTDFVSTRRASMEAFDETENRKAVVNTVAYNIEASRQNAFGEAFFPTVVYTNDSVGAQVSIKINEVGEDTKHDLSGNLTRTGRRNLIKAYIHNDILKNFQTEIVPRVRTGTNDDKFVDPAVVANQTIIVEGESITTNYLVPGVPVNVISLGTKDGYLTNGRMDLTDSIDPAVQLTSLLVDIDGNILSFNTRSLATNTFVAAPQGVYRQSNLTFGATPGIHKGFTGVGGAALAGDLAVIDTDDLVVQVRLSASGSINLEKGDLEVYGGSLAVVRVLDKATGNLVDLTDARVAPIVAAVAVGKVIGYKTQQFMTNLNRREQGQIINTNYYNQIWTVPLLSPITARNPVNAPTTNDNAELATLISTTHVRTSNLAVKALTGLINDLRDYQAGRITAAGLPGNEDNAPETFGIGRFLVEPTLIEQNVNVATSINSLMSHQQSADVAAVLVNVIRDITYRMYRDSEYQAAVDSQAAGVRGDPTVIIGTDPRTARFLMIDGEIRLAGPDFKAQVVTSPDLEVQDKIFIAFGYPDQFKGEINPMHLGNMIWYPEVVLALPTQRDGRFTKELTVQPRFRHIVNLPVVGYVTVQGLSEAITGKIVLNQHPIP